MTGQGSKNNFEERLIAVKRCRVRGKKSERERDPETLRPKTDVPPQGTGTGRVTGPSCRGSQSTVVAPRPIQ